MILLFAGPSLSGTTRPIPPGVELRPPARAGDVAAAIPARPRAMAIVDGVFAIAPAVWHKEILDALAQGIPVLGAASLGALRAAELHMFGMEGVGEIYAACRDGALVRDDAVLVSHAPAELGHRPLSLALVDAEDSIRRASLPPDARCALLRIARRMPFHRRTWGAILAAHPDGEALRHRLSSHLSSRKAADVDLLLERLRQPISPPPLLPAPPLTRYYVELRARAGSH